MWLRSATPTSPITVEQCVLHAYSSSRLYCEWIPSAVVLIKRSSVYLLHTSTPHETQRATNVLDRKSFQATLNLATLTSAIYFIVALRTFLTLMLTSTVYFIVALRTFLTFVFCRQPEIVSLVRALLCHDDVSCFNGYDALITYQTESVCISITHNAVKRVQSSLSQSKSVLRCRHRCNNISVLQLS